MTRNNYQRKTTLIEGSHQKQDLWTQDFDRYERARVRTLMETNSTHWHGRQGDADYLNTRGTKGNRWKLFGNQGRQSDI